MHALITEVSVSCSVFKQMDELHWTSRREGKACLDEDGRAARNQINRAGNAVQCAVCSCLSTGQSEAQCMARR